MLRKPITPKGSCLLRDVAKLNDLVTGIWDVQLVRDIFWRRMQELSWLYWSMEIGRIWLPDILTKKGVFFVKSAYKVLRDDQIRRRSREGGLASNPDPAYESMWKRQWELNCAGIIKHFLWRFAYNSHPLRMNRRGMDIDTRCVICQRLNEDGAHLFFKCKTIAQVWIILGLE
jgi:hypothetical protein